MASLPALIRYFVLSDAFCSFFVPPLSVYRESNSLCNLNGFTDLRINSLQGTAL